MSAIAAPEQHRNPPKLDVVVVGGGVAALETALALYHLAASHTAVTLVAPDPELTYRPLSVGMPFSHADARRHPLAELARDAGGAFVQDRITEVIGARHCVRLGDGRELTYDALVLAPGAVRRSVELHAITFAGQESADALSALLTALERGEARRVAFVVPPGAAWPLPAYELAIMTARAVRSMEIEHVELVIVSPEPSPLATFGPTASQAVSTLLDAAAITFHGSAHPAIRAGSVALGDRRDPLLVDRIVTLPTLEGPRLPGVPCDADGFIPVDEFGRVPGVPDAYAIGDATTFPVKQGGIATQQADAVAVAIAADAGVQVDLEPCAPVLRGILMTGGPDLSLRNFLARASEGGEAAEHALWWPPAKVAGRYLAPYLHGREEDELLGLLTPGPHVAVRHPLEAPPLLHAQGQADIELLGQDRPRPPAARRLAGHPR